MPRLSLPVAGEKEPEPPLYEGDQAQLDRDIVFVSRKRMAEKIVGGFSKPSKMPCYAWGLPASRCRIGSVLAQKPNTTCSECYALKNLFRMGNVQAAYERRYQGIFNPLWVAAMIAMCRWYCDDYMRLFDSGDVQGVNHQLNIMRIALNVRDVIFWEPSREIQTIHTATREAIKLGIESPDNLVVRLSAHMIDGKPPKWPTTSTVVTDHADATCPALQQSNNCGDCRACWDPTVRNVAYPLH